MAARASSAQAASGSGDRKSTRLNSSHGSISYAVFCLKKKKIEPHLLALRTREQLEFNQQYPSDGERHGESCERVPAAPEEVSPCRHRFFFFTAAGSTETYPLSLHDALPI